MATNKVAVTCTKLDTLANSIGSKSGEGIPLTLDEMVDAVEAMEILVPQTKVVTPSNVQQIITPDTEYGYNGLTQVTVAASAGGSGDALIISDTIDSAGGTIREITTTTDPVMLTPKTITSNGTYYAQSDDVNGYSQVTVNVEGGDTGAFTIVESQDTNGGIIKNIVGVDISDTTATAADVASGKYFYTANGTKTQGTALVGDITQDQDGYLVLSPTGGSRSTSWVRPSSWPDLSKMDISSGDILYMTSYADEAKGFCSFSFSCTGSYTVEVGTVSGSTFTADSSQTYTSGTTCNLYYGSANGTFKVLRVTGTALTDFRITRSSTITIGTFNGYTCNQGIIDIVGKLPSCTINSDFSNLYNLVNMKIDIDKVTGNRSSMFNSCYSLVSLDVSSWDVSAVTSMGSMFQNCYCLNSLDVSSWDVSAVTSMSNMFYCCYSLALLDVSSWDVSAVTGMNNMFYYCASLTSLDVSSWNVSTVTNMNSMFQNCYSLTSLDVSSWDVSAVTNMGTMFSNCSSLTSLNISSWDVGAVTNMNNLFYQCYSLTSLDVSSWDFSGLTDASNAGSTFRNCRGLHGSITLPATVTQIGTYFFTDTRSLTEYHFLSTTPPALANTNAFNNMTDFGGKKIYVPAASLSAYQTASNWSTYASYMIGE